MPWQMFNENFNLQFSPPLYGNPLGELVSLKQDGLVEDYRCQFQQRRQLLKLIKKLTFLP